MAELPYMPYVPTEYLGDTNHLSTLEHGAYHLLILQYWINAGALPDNDVRLSRIAKMSERQWKKIRPTIEEFFIVDGTTWVHKRIEMDLKRAREKVDFARKAGLASAAARRNKRSTKGQRSFNGRSTDVEQSLPSRSNGTATNHKSKNTPLTPQKKKRTRKARSDTGSRGGRSDRGGGAVSIGDVLKGKKE